MEFLKVVQTDLMKVRPKIFLMEHQSAVLKALKNE